MTEKDWTDADIALVHNVRGVYDGWIVATLRDGRHVNRFEGVPGYERVAAAADQHIATLRLGEELERKRAEGVAL